MERLAALKNELSAVKSNMATKTQQDENTAFIKALLHRTEELDAKLDNLALNSASRESIADLSAKLMYSTTGYSSRKLTCNA